MDKLVELKDIYTMSRINGWDSSECTGVELSLADYDALEVARDSVAGVMDEVVVHNYEKIYVQTVEEMNPALFAWLDILDGTVWVILVLVLAVAGFTMISGLLILILEKSNLIGAQGFGFARCVDKKNIPLLCDVHHRSWYVVGKHYWSSHLFCAAAVEHCKTRC